ncbi:hypothetical protein AVEN_26164-1 [Araneus ventricosus]|uniref:PiggyBac transposable element-derived protein domain-containing protein n=1 Tax=Araneus ventricosus TaxID=182803 RepID=A0A4Y2EP17_ARAVE|nr:hypothetical protein AVEN_26164-1 [Araneus ventricosus]
MPIPYEKEMERLLKLLAEVETTQDPYFDSEDDGPEDVLEEIFSDHESLCGHDTESKEDGDYGNCFHQKRALSREKKCRQNIVSCLPGTKGSAKDVTSPVKSWELFINDNMIHLIVE